MTRFASEQMHQMASTATFEQAVTTAFDEPMDWFFDQWVYGVDVPTYRADLRVVAGSDVEGEAPFRLSGTVQQEDVPDGFRMPVPIAVRFADRPPLLRRVWVDTGMVDVDLPLPARPTEVEFNYLNGVLANLR
jgi:aminopeptidase N